MFDVYHKLTAEEEKMVQDVFDAKNEVKRLQNTRMIYQKDLEMLQDNDKGRIGVIIVSAIPAIFFWTFFIGDLGIIFFTKMDTMFAAIAVASAAPVMAIISTVFFFVFLYKHLLIYSKNEKYIQKAKKANIHNFEAYRQEIYIKYMDISSKVKDAEAHLKILEEELERMEEKSRTEGLNHLEAVKNINNGNKEKKSGESNR